MNQFNLAWSFYAKNWKFFIMLSAPVMMLEVGIASMIMPIQGATQPEDISNFLNENLIFLLSISLLGMVMSMAFMGAIFISYASIENKNEADPLSILFAGIKKFFPLFGAYFLASIATFVGLLLLILPGFYIAGRLCLFPALIMLENKSVTESLSISWEETDEHGGTLFGLTFVFFALMIFFILIAKSLIAPGLTQLIILAIIEYVIVIPWGYVYFSLYKSLKRH
ncbi:hypothetical protein OAV17_03150 [Gammaproteobacteria bacterium]|nr:hypothetical protein [Gammaproteobacteria bacterium]MDA9220714.1 hypothetical protein [Gammaproteobacteria bacterium]MDC1014973.1 hypothetical protein [Gammaproteobacteria bacterium]MDC3289215.1 hypothetical protein [Gammaproteobacteria bacterium]